MSVERIVEIKQALRSLPRDAHGNQIWPRNVDEEPDWVKLRDELADLTGEEIHRARFRTARAFDAGVQLCAQRLLVSAARAAADDEEIQASEALEDIRMQLRRSHVHSVTRYAERWRVDKGVASRRITKLETDGLIRTKRSGREKLIVWARAFDVIERADVA